MKRSSTYQVLDVRAFGEDLMKLARKYPAVIHEVESLFEEFEQGNLSGKDIPGLRLESDKVFKTRLKNPDANKGKRGGFRVVWYLVTFEKEIYPLTNLLQNGPSRYY